MPNDERCREIAKNMPQFKDEWSTIELTMMKLSVEVRFTHKAHCALAGRGVEYLWGVSKILFRKENACLDNDKRVNNSKPIFKKIITNVPMETYQKCSRRSREHKLSYAALLSDDDANKVDLKLQDIEKMKKEIKNKRCAMDQDYSLFKWMAEVIEIVDDNDCKKTKDVVKFEFRHQKNKK